MKQLFYNIVKNLPIKLILFYFKKIIIKLFTKLSNIQKLVLNYFLKIKKKKLI
jgi:hypothetical protein